MEDTWQALQELKNKHTSFRVRLQQRKKERTLLQATATATATPSSTPDPPAHDSLPSKAEEYNIEVEYGLLRVLSNISLEFPVSSKELANNVGKDINLTVVESLLKKFAAQQLITVKDVCKEPGELTFIEVQSVEHVKLAALANEFTLEPNTKGETENDPTNLKKRKGEENSDEISTSSSKLSKPTENKDEKKTSKKDTDLLSLLSMPSSREKENKKMGEEILDLLSKPTVKERSLAEKFKSQGGAQVMEFCPHGTRAECIRTQKQSSDSGENNQQSSSSEKVHACKKLHFKKIIQMHTDETLGDCSFLNTCFHMDTCKYVHYEVDGAVHQQKDELSSINGSSVSAGKGSHMTTQSIASASSLNGSANQRLSGNNPNARTSGSGLTSSDATTLYPPQWVQCDLRFLDMTVLGKFAVIMADPPWDIHMELPYGTMSDDEMRQLGVPQLQDDGLIFLWVTGRAMELGRECLKLWGYERVDEIIWVKTNQLQRIIRTGRTGHWLNHGKEHCLVGMKGKPKNLNRGLDCDVIVAEVRATSHKPDEIYGIIERLSPGTRKIELFGRPHNVQPNWITLGNQVDGVRLVDPELIQAFQKRYPDGNCMKPKQDII